MFKSFLAVLAVSAVVWAQPMVTGYINPSNNGSWFRMNTEQALNSATTVHSCVSIDSATIRPTAKWGSNYILKCIYNNSGSTMKLMIVDSTKETGLDTFPYHLAAHSNTLPLPYSVFIYGITADSALAVRQYIGR